MTKPTVRYNPTPNDFIRVGTSAYVIALDHPRLGHTDVTTSTVESYDKETGVFETKNTKYIPDFQ